MSIERANAAYRELLSESLDKAIAAETRRLRERLIEAEAEHAQAMMRLSDHYRHRQERSGVMMIWMVVLSWAAGVGMCWAAMR